MGIDFCETTLNCVRYDQLRLVVGTADAGEGAGLERINTHSDFQSQHLRARRRGPASLSTHTVAYDPFIKSQLASTKSISGPHVIQISWPESGLDCLTCGIFARQRMHLRGGLVFEARRLLYHSTPGSSVFKKRKKDAPPDHGLELDRSSHDPDKIWP